MLSAEPNMDRIPPNNTAKINISLENTLPRSNYFFASGEQSLHLNKKIRIFAAKFYTALQNIYSAMQYIYPTVQNIYPARRNQNNFEYKKLRLRVLKTIE